MSYQAEIFFGYSTQNLGLNGPGPGAVAPNKNNAIFGDFDDFLARLVGKFKVFTVRSSQKFFCRSRESNLVNDSSLTDR